jgi:prevent-host-death family protein
MPRLPVKTVAFTEARRDLARTLDAVEHAGGRFVIQRRGRDSAALISVADLELFLLLEDRLEEDWARDALRSARKEQSETHPFDELRADLGLA